MKDPSTEKRSSKEIIVTPHKDGSYDCCVFNKQTGPNWEHDALEYASEVLEQLWNDIDIHKNISVHMEYRDMVEKEHKSTKDHSCK